MDVLDGKVAIVTGGGRGIGAAVARALGTAGSMVVVNDLGVSLKGTEADDTPAHEVAEDIVAAGGAAIANTEDIGDHAGAGRLVQSAIDVFGRLDILVNVAGILRDRMIFNMTEEEWDAVIRVHLKGTFNTSKHAASYWRKAAEEGAGRRLINFTSDSGIYGAPGQPNYAAAKMGIIGLTLSCANSLARYGVTANAIAPVADTRMNADVPAENRRAAGPGGKAPEHVASVVTFIASDDASWCTGRIIGVNGLQVSLFCEPQVVRQIASSTPWEHEQLKTMMANVFQPVPRNSAGRYDALLNRRASAAPS